MVESLSIDKPAYGEPCNRCGWCCFDSICDLGQHILKRKERPGPCPALVWHDDGTASCGLVLFPGKYAPMQVGVHGAGLMREAAKQLIGAGGGCGMRFHSEFDDPEFRKSVEARIAQKRQARDLWGM
jgi:hypothetical protein